MAEEIEFENRHFRNFKGLVTLTLGDLESRTIVYVSSISIRITNDQISRFNFIVNGRTDGRTDARTDGRTAPRHNPPSGPSGRRGITRLIAEA